MKKQAITIIIVVAMTSALWAWYQPDRTIEYREVEVPKEVLKIKRVEIPVEKVKVVYKDRVIKEVSLPREIKENPKEQILAVGVVEPHEAETVVTATLNTATGITKLLYEQKRQRLVSLESAREIGLRAGISSGGGVGAVYGRWDFFRVGNLHFGLYADIATYDNGHNEAKALFNIAYKF